MAATTFQIEDGRVYLALVDSEAVGYLDTWQAPSGKTAATAAAADYPGTTGWSCQVTSGMLTASANTNDVTVPATFCQASSVIPQPGITSYSLDLEWLQDVNTDIGLNKFLFENDTEEAYFYLGLDAENPPCAIGRVRLLAGSFGGPARENLTSTVSLPCSRKPDIEFGTTGDSTIVEGGEAVLLAAEEFAAEPEPVGV